jgi:hypothetical protein
LSGLGFSNKQAGFLIECSLLERAKTGLVRGYLSSQTAALAAEGLSSIIRGRIRGWFYWLWINVSQQTAERAS